MMTPIKITYPDTTTTSTTSVFLDEFCPHCGIEGMPIVFHASTEKLYNSIPNIVGVFVRCPRSDCGKFSVQSFTFEKYTSESNSVAKVSEKIPYSFKAIFHNDLPQEVKEGFPDFNNIFNQSLEAESLGLDQIAGMGFRKSLEFLIKQYAARREPDKEEKINKETLNNTIENRYADFPKLQKLAKVASWIGNDESHLVKKHTEMDIQNMKAFIRSASLFISADMDADIADTYIEESKIQ